MITGPSAPQPSFTQRDWCHDSTRNQAGGQLTGERAVWATTHLNDYVKKTPKLNASAFADTRKKATTKADIADAVAVRLLKMAIGSKDSSSSKEMEVVADPEKYR